MHFGGVSPALCGSTAPAEEGAYSACVATQEWPGPPLAVAGEESVGLRRAGPDDEPFLRRLFVATRPHLASLPLPPDQREVLIGQQLAGRQRHLATTYDDAQSWVIEQSGKPVGHLVTATTTTHVWIVEIEIAPEVQGHGVGGAVVERVADSAAARGLPTRLHVAADNRAQRLYRRLGFVVPPDEHADDRTAGPTATADLLMERPCPTSRT